MQGPSGPSGSGGTTAATNNPNPNTTNTTPAWQQSLGGTGATGNVLPTVWAPGAATSVYQQQSVQSAGNTVDLGPDVARIFGLSAGPVPIGQLVADYNHLSKSQLVALQSALSKGGFYTISGGQKPSSFGALDDNSYSAFFTAALQASQTGQTLDDTINSGAAAGTGAQLQQQGMQPQVGGANTYQINLTNPESLAASARTIFQAALGRNATPDELNRMTAALQSNEAQVQQAAISQSETASQARYQAGQAAEQAAAVPPPNLGPLPNGPFKDMGQWSAALLQYMRVPVTQSNVATIMAWANASGTSLSSNNPLGITLPKSGSTSTSAAPGGAAQNYANPSDGIQATAQTLLENQYPYLLQALSQGDAESALSSPQVQSELKQFSGGAYSDLTTGAKTAEKQAGQAANTYNPPKPAAVATPPVTHQGERRAPTDGQEPNPNTLAAQNAPTANQQFSAGVDQYAAAQQAATVAATGGLTAPGTQATQQPTAPGSTYIPATTITQVTPLTPAEEEYQTATTGANQIPYLGYQYLQAFNAIVAMIQHGGPTGTGGGGMI